MATTLTQTLSSKTETTITMDWVANVKANRVRYSSDNGSTWTSKTVSAKSGSYTISGLQPNHSYKIKTEIRSADSGTTTTTSALSVKTYNWPTATCPTVAIAKEKLVVTLTNPLSRPCDVEFYVGSTLIESFSNIVKPVSLPTTYASAFLTKIPNSSTGTYTVNVYYGEHTTTTNGTFTSVGAEPTLTNVTYRDTNSTAQAIIQDSSVILQGVSLVEYTATATAKYGASMVSIYVSVEGRQSANGGLVIQTPYPISSASDVVAKVTVNDSRGNSTTKNYTVHVTPNVAPTAVITLMRHNNYYPETDLTVDASVMYLGSNVPTITARYKERSGSTWYNWPQLSDNVTSTISLDNQKAWDVEITVVDSFNNTSVFNASVEIGMSILYIDRGMRAIGVNCFPTADTQFAVNDVDVINELVYKSGDTINISNVALAGIVTSSRTKARFTIPCAKSLALITSITVDNCIGGVRVPTGGYMNDIGDSSDWVGRTGITVAAEKAGDSNIVLMIDTTGTFSNVVNNMPVTMWTNSVVLNLE